MTAIVGVLNSRCVAFAADSAATHTTKDNKYKITNNTNKIFTLSKYHPVGIALYNNLDFMGIPWETIIKMCRNNLGTKKCKTLDEYIKEFWIYIKKNCLSSTAIMQQSYLNTFLNRFYQEVHSNCELAVGQKTDANASQYYQKYIELLDNWKTSYQRQKQSDDFKAYTLKQFQKYASNTIDVLLANDISSPNCPTDFRKKFEESAHSFLCLPNQTYFSGYTGLVFFGFGDEEIFPSYREYKVSYAMDNHIKYSLLDKYTIAGSGDAVVKPFAQRDVASSVIWAVEDTLKATFYKNFETSIDGFRNEIVRQLTASGAPQQLIDIMNGLDVNSYVVNYKVAWISILRIII